MAAGLTLTIRELSSDDLVAWMSMRRALWPEEDGAALDREARQYVERGEVHGLEAVLVALDATGMAIGMVELNIRPYAEGCVSERVGYLEAWYVVPSWRHRGVGRALVAAAESWARTRGCTEFASDAELDNTVSIAAHKAIGFAEVVQIACFKKPLGDRS